MDNNCKNEGRRDFLKKSTALAALAVASPALVKAGENDEKIAALFEKIPLNIEVNGKAYSLSVEPRTCLLYTSILSYFNDIPFITLPANYWNGVCNYWRHINSRITI